MKRSGTEVVVEMTVECKIMKAAETVIWAALLAKNVALSSVAVYALNSPDLCE